MINPYVSGQVTLQITKHGYYEVFPRPTEIFLSEYYTNTYYQNPHGSYSSNYSKEELLRINLRNEILIHAVGQPINKGQVLEIGCGEGFLLSKLMELNYDVIGIDFNDYGVGIHNPIALPLFTKGNIYQILNNLVEKNNRFETIYLNNVLEHVLEPEDLLINIKKILTKTGKLIITVPNDFSDLQMLMKGSNKFEKEYWIGFPDHLNYFNTTSLKSLLAFCEFDLVKKMADFPIEWFILNEHANYAKYPELGKSAHEARVFLENYINSLPNKDLVVNFWESMANIKLGRNIIAIFTPIK